MSTEKQVFDMGYFGPNHSKYGIVLHIDATEKSMTLLDITNPLSKEEVVVPIDDFVCVKNLKDMANAVEQNICNQQMLSKMSGSPCIKDVRVVTKTNYALALYNAKQTYSKDVVNANPNYRDQRESILRTLLDISQYDNECMSDLGRLLRSDFDYNHRILTITPSKGTQTFHITLSIIGKEIIVHNTSVRYDSHSIFKDIKCSSHIPSANTNRGLLATA